MEVVTIDVHLSVEVKGQALLAHLTFTNNTSDQLYLDRYTTCLDGLFRNEVFEIFDEKGRKISYTGPVVKRKLKPEDYVLLHVDEKISSTVNLKEVYNLIKGKKYHVQFSAFNPGLQNDAPLIDLESNTVKFFFR